MFMRYFESCMAAVLVVYAIKRSAQGVEHTTTLDEFHAVYTRDVAMIMMLCSDWHVCELSLALCKPQTFKVVLQHHSCSVMLQVWGHAHQLHDHIECDF